MYNRVCFPIGKGPAELGFLPQRTSREISDWKLRTFSSSAYPQADTWRKGGVLGTHSYTSPDLGQYFGVFICDFAPIAQTILT